MGSVFFWGGVTLYLSKLKENILKYFKLNVLKDIAIGFRFGFKLGFKTISESSASLFVDLPV